MILQFIENSIRLFLKDEQPQVMGIYGVWGNGKTFFWNKEVRNKNNCINSKFNTDIIDINNINLHKIISDNPVLLRKYNIPFISSIKYYSELCNIRIVRKLLNYN